MADAIAVSGIMVKPTAETALADGAVEWRPKGLLGAGWDSNPLHAANGSQDGAWISGLAALEMRLNGAGGMWQCRGEGVVERRVYVSGEGANATNGRCFGSLRYAGDTTTCSLSAAWEREDQPVAEIPQVVPRDFTFASWSLLTLAARRSWSFRLRVEDLDYLEATPYSGENERDYQRLLGETGYMLLGDDFSRLGIVFAAESVQRPDVALITNHTGWSLDGRWRHAFEGRSYMELRLGAMQRFYQTPTADFAPNDDQTITAPLASLNVTWSWEERSKASLIVRTDLAEGFTESANAAYRYMVESQVRVTIADRFAVVADTYANYLQETGAAPGLLPAHRLFLFFGLGPEYRLRSGMALRLDGRYWASTDDQGHVFEYPRAEVALSIAAAL